MDTNKFKEYEKYAEDYDETATDIWEIMWEKNMPEEELERLNSANYVDEWLAKPSKYKRVNLDF
jgi:hypothetical protein